MLSREPADVDHAVVDHPVVRSRHVLRRNDLTVNRRTKFEGVIWSIGPHIFYQCVGDFNDQ
jgi:hypothetical protein